MHTTQPDPPDGMTYIDMCCWPPDWEPSPAAVAEAEEREGQTLEDARRFRRSWQHQQEMYEQEVDLAVQEDREPPQDPTAQEGADANNAVVAGG